MGVFGLKSVWKKSLYIFSLFFFLTVLTEETYPPKAQNWTRRINLTFLVRGPRKERHEEPEGVENL